MPWTNKQLDAALMVAKGYTKYESFNEDAAVEMSRALLFLELEPRAPACFPDFIRQASDAARPLHPFPEYPLQGG